MTIMLSKDIAQALIDADVIPKNTRRVIIDISFDSAVMLYYETYADEETFDLDLETLLKGAKRIPISEVAAKSPPTRGAPTVAFTGPGHEP